MTNGDGPRRVSPLAVLGRIALLVVGGGLVNAGVFLLPWLTEIPIVGGARQWPPFVEVFATVSGAPDEPGWWTPVGLSILIGAPMACAFALVGLLTGSRVVRRAIAIVLGVALVGLAVANVLSTTSGDRFVASGVVVAVALALGPLIWTNHAWWMAWPGLLLAAVGAVSSVTVIVVGLGADPSYLWFAWLAPAGFALLVVTTLWIIAARPRTSSVAGRGEVDGAS